MIELLAGPSQRKGTGRRKTVNSTTASVYEMAHILSLCELATRAGSASRLDLERLFSELDQRLAEANDASVKAVLGDARFRQIRERLLVIRAEYEYARERRLAHEIVAAGDESPLRAFRSAAWYEEAHEFEMRALAPFAPRRLLIVGSGPFPTSAIAFMRANPQIRVSCIERIPEACALAVDVAEICGCDGLEMIEADATEVSDFTDYDCVLVGTVVGVTDTEKEQVVRHFMRRVPASTLLIFRTAVGPGRIIYPTVKTGLLGACRHRLLADPPHKTFSMIITDRRNHSA